MIEKIGAVRNPLTVIAMFAGLAEVSGTIVLPFISDVVQVTFVWFLMVFPVLLVMLFFGTLWLKPVVLYAPSDYKDERIFQDLFVPTKPEDRTREIEEEVASEVGAVAQPSATEQRVEPVGQNTKIAETANLQMTANDFGIISLVAEDYAVRKLQSIVGMPFSRQVSPRGMPQVRFDAVSTSSEKIIAVDVKYTRSGRPSADVLDRTLARVERFYQALTSVERKVFEFIIVYVVDQGAVERVDQLKARAARALSQHSFSSRIEIFTFAELETEFGAPRVRHE